MSNTGTLVMTRAQKAAGRRQTGTVRVWCSNRTVCPLALQGPRAVQAGQPLRGQPAPKTPEPDHPAQTPQTPQTDRALTPAVGSPLPALSGRPQTRPEGVPPQSARQSLQSWAEKPSLEFLHSPSELYDRASKAINPRRQGRMRGATWLCQFAPFTVPGIGSWCPAEGPA